MTVLTILHVNLENVSIHVQNLVSVLQMPIVESQNMKQYVHALMVL